MSAPKVDVITVRWDAATATYRVDRPDWDGGKVVMYDAVAELINAANSLRSAHDAFKEWSSLHPDESAPRLLLEMNVRAKAWVFSALARIGNES